MLNAGGDQIPIVQYNNLHSHPLYNNNMKVIIPFLIVYVILHSSTVLSAFISTDKEISLSHPKMTHLQTKLNSTQKRMLSIFSMSNSTEKNGNSRKGGKQFSFLEELLMKMAQNQTLIQNNHKSNLTSIPSPVPSVQNKDNLKEKQFDASLSKTLNSTQKKTQIKQIQSQKTQNSMPSKPAGILSQFNVISNLSKQPKNQTAIAIGNNNIVQIHINQDKQPQNQNTQPDTKSNSKSVDQPSATTIIHTQPNPASPSAEICSINQYLLVAVIGLSALVIILSFLLVCCYLRNKTRIKNAKSNEEMPQHPLTTHQRPTYFSQ